ncbi:MAG: histidine kinase [Mycobacterium sp.]|nr:histidine kinase [Mycobacterium sp.]
MSGPNFDDLWENAPCGHIVATPDGRIVMVNATLAGWLGYAPDAMRGRFVTDLLTIGGAIHYETHFGPLLHMSGDLTGVTLDFVATDGRRLPMFLTANVKRSPEGDPALLRLTAQDASDRRAYERELLHERQRAERESARVKVFAETLRRSLLPPVLSPPDGLEAADYYYAASEDDIGGDFYDLFPLSRSTWGFFLGDVSGKGVDAAVLTGLTRYTLRAAAAIDDEPVVVLRNLDTVLAQALGNDATRFCTLIYGRLTRTEGGFDVEMASGGHPPPLVLYADGTAYYADTTGGQAVGMTRNPHFVSTRLRLEPGDTLVLYTDGLTEASTGRGYERYDDTGALLAFARENSPTTATSIMTAIHDLLDGLGTGVEDDAAVLALSVPANLAD